MRVLVQWSRQTPRDWEEVSADAWRHTPARPIPTAVGGQDNAPGWVSRLNIQGVDFAGYDHYHIEPIAGGGCRVTVWIDDPDDVDTEPLREFYARVWTFLPLAPDPERGGAYNTRQSQVVYAGPRLTQYYIDNPTENTEVRPLAEFVPPADDAVRHGVWLDDALHLAHEQTKSERGWREWTDGIPAAMLDARGRVRAGRGMGLYNKPQGTKTFGLRDTDLTNGIHTATNENTMTRDAFGAGETEACNNMSSGASELGWVWVSASTEPNDGDWPSGNYRAQLDCGSGSAEFSYGMRAAGGSTGHFARVNSGITADSQTWAQSEALFTGTGLKLATTGTIDPSAGSATDRWEVLCAVTRTTNHGNASMSLTYDTDAFTDGPWVPAATYEQTHFRIRSADTVGLNTDSGWAAAEDTGATIGRGVRFRIRFRIRETTGSGGTDDIHLQCRLNGGSWLDVFELGVGTGAESPAQAIYSLQFTDGAATSTQLLTSSGGTYANGEGDSDNIVVTAISNEESEYEFCVQIMSTYDAGAHNEVVPSNTVDFRVVRGAIGSAILLDTYTNTPTVTVADTANYIGGAYVETPNRLGPFMDGNQNLYFVCEYAETFNDMTVRKSTDDGATWRVIDGANRPNENDMEGADVVQSGTELYILVVTTTVTFHSFRTSDAGTGPDTWQIKDQVVDGSYTPSASQQGCIEARSDGTFVAFYNDGASPARIHYRIRSSGGTWGGDNLVDTEAATNFTGVRTVKAGSDTIHIFYKDDTNGIVYHRTLSSGDSLSGRQSIATGISTGVTPDATTVLPPQYWNDGSEQVLALYQKAIDGPIFSKLLTGGTPGSELQATDFGAGTDGAGAGSDAPDATATLDPSYGNSRLAFVLYHRVSDGDLYRATYTPGSGWGTDDNIQTAVDVNFVGANVFTHANGKVLGYVYDDAAAGGSGQIWYGEVALDVILTPTPATVAFTATTPTVVQISNPTPATVAFTATTPTVQQGGQQVNPDAAVVAFTATTPTVQRGAISVSPTPATVAFTATTPVVSAPEPANILYPVIQAVMPWRT